LCRFGIHFSLGQTLLCIAYGVRMQKYIDENRQTKLSDLLGFVLKDRPSRETGHQCISSGTDNPRSSNAANPTTLVPQSYCGLCLIDMHPKRCVTRSLRPPTRPDWTPARSFGQWRFDNACLHIVRLSIVRPATAPSSQRMRHEDETIFSVGRFSGCFPGIAEALDWGLRGVRCSCRAV
jgi:hypothetical protein